MKCVAYRGTGGREVVEVTERPDPEPSKFEVLIAPAYAGVNPADVLQREGRHPPPQGSPTDVPGLEVAGTIVACGEHVSAFAVGDRAFGLVGGGGLADRVLAHERELVPVPDILDELAAAAVPEAFMTAFDAICRQAGLAAGDTLLVNGANGGVGTAAIQIAAAIGARVVASVRSEGVRARVGQLGATALAPADAFAQVKSLGGADVILELVGAVNMRDNVMVLAELGRIIVVGAAPGDEAQIALRDLMSRRGQLIGTTLRRRPPEQKAQLIQEFGRRIVPQLATGKVVPIVDRVFDLDDAADALDQVRAPGKFGKILLATDGASVGVPSK
jgi:putative PIG3 family NAD(P)H quinone oxidoreductase